MLTLAWPWVWLLLPLPLICWWWYRRDGSRPSSQAPQESAPLMPQAVWLQDLPGVSSDGKPASSVRRSQWLWLALAWTFLIMALSRPQQIGEPVSFPVSGRDLMLAVDISPSMEETDMVIQGRSMNRLDALKLVLDDFIAGRRGDRLGLLLFATEPYIQAPLTFDHTTVRVLLNEAGIGMAGRATAIGDAIGLAVKRLRERPQDQRVLILLTDGVSNAGNVTPEKAAEIAAAAGVRIHTIGMGADAMIQQGLFGPREINPSRDLDEDQLRAIAQLTGGRYFRARNLQDLQDVYRILDQIEPLELEGRSYRPVKELFVWPAGLAALTWLAVVMGSRRRSLPAPVQRQGQRLTAMVKRSHSND